MGTHAPADGDQSQGLGKAQVAQQQAVAGENLLVKRTAMTGTDGQLGSLGQQEQPSWGQRENFLSYLFLFIHVCVYCVQAEVRGQLLSGLRDNHLYHQAIAGPKILSAFLEVLKQKKTNKPKNKTALSLNIEATSHIKHAINNTTELFRDLNINYNWAPLRAAKQSLGGQCGYTAGLSQRRALMSNLRKWKHRMASKGACCRSC